MKNLLHILFVGLLLFNSIYFGKLYLSKSSSTIPIDHVILVNSDIQVNDLINNDFKFLGMECGIIEYAKTKKDTTITYSLDFENECSIFPYSTNTDSNSIYFPFNKRLVKNSIIRNLAKRVDINFKGTT